jgi:integrase
MSPRAHGEHVRKVCGCGWRQWPKCSHPWYLSYKPRGGARYRFSFDAEFGGHIESKIEAEKKAATIRSEIDAGTFERTADRLVRLQREAAEQATRGRSDEATPSVTFDTFATIYVERVAKSSGKASWKDDEYLLGTVRNHRTVDGRRLGDLPLLAITEDELEAFHAAQRAAGRAASTLNHFVQVIKAAFRWAVHKGYLARSPISIETALKRSKMAKRTRRISPDEEAALLAVASPRLQNIIIGAIETAMRRGELLGLTWRDVDLDDRVLTVRAETAKDDETRLLPISQRLAAVLTMAKTDPAGEDYPREAFVFGEFGEQVGSIKRAWETAVLKAHGIKPVWNGGKLSTGCRAHLRRIDLRFHDLRREAGSRWHEGGFQLHEVRDPAGTRERQSDGHVFERQDRRPARIDETV